MIDFLAKFFRREEASSSRARERLRLVLMSDRVSLAPDIFDAMKGEMLDVLRRYLEIDERGMDVHFENAERQFALMANIPVREVRLSAGAEFIVVICGEIMTMPGLPKVPSADSIDVNAQGKIVGLF